ncbi:MAG: glycosyltransferase family 2 protein [Gammaproteobacteria bacterium]|nr:glycosyltransferase family 2 protein [Gammaproteobacteria bacterium]
MDESKREFEWRFSDLAKMYLFLAITFFLITQIPNRIWYNETFQLALGLGFIGIWRYSWWLVHFFRAQIFSRSVFPKQRAAADAVWDAGWRPKTLNILMTTYREDKKITERVIASILRECRLVGVPSTLFVGSGDDYDEQIITAFIQQHGKKIDLKVVFVRQNKPGKRFAIGLVLRAMARYGVDGDDPVVFMDGDSVLGQECLKKCLPIFMTNPGVEALTTDEKVIVEEGPEWVRAWLNMRFAQRHLGMQSHALSNKVLTLTGRMSVFRARNVVNKDFIRTIEVDYLNHWLWDRFRFLSGDDKSTWYWLLKSGADMYYVPDALVTTIERIEGNGRERMVQNLLRWSGNILRNGSRAIALGPRRVGPFIWWCIVDQRLAMWTTLVGPISAIILAFYIEPIMLLVYLVWVIISRTFLALLLYPYAGRIYVSFPFFLFINQLINSIVKVYIVFRLPKQRWMNRGNQKAIRNADSSMETFRHAMAGYLTALWVFAFVFGLMLYLGIVKPLPIL